MAKRGVNTGLQFDEIGYWSEIKLDIIKKYAQAYSKIMAAQPDYMHHAYVDGFSGPGQCVSRTSGEWLPGSPLNACIPILACMRRSCSMSSTPGTVAPWADARTTSRIRAVDPSTRDRAMPWRPKAGARPASSPLATRQGQASLKRRVRIRFFR